MKIYKHILLVLFLLFPAVANAQYQGETFFIDCSRGGFNNDINKDRVAPYSLAEGTRNINIHEGGRSKRGGTDNVNSTVITDTPRIWGLEQFGTSSAEVAVYTATSDGKIQKDYTTTIKTGLTIDQAVHFEVFNNQLIICTGNDMPQVLLAGGTNTANLANVPTDWSSNSNFPRKMVKHGRGASERLWAIGGDVEPFTVYASALSSKDETTEPDFSDVNVITIYVDTGDEFGLLNAVEYGDRLVCASKKQIFIIDDLDTDTANWGYEKSQWEGGTASDRTLIAVTNDIVSMTEDGTIFSVTSAQNYGDYKKASLTRPAFIDEWIRDNIKLSAIDDFHMIYDPVLRCIYFFFVRTGQTNVDTALTYFIDRGPEEGWVIKDNTINDSGYKASSSALVRKAVGDNKIYTGGWDDGFVWELETTTFNDNGSLYQSGFKTPRFHLGDPRLTKRFDTGWIILTSKGNFDVFINVWVDGEFISQETISIMTQGAVYGTGVYDTGVYGGTTLIEEAFDIGAEGKRLELQVFNNNANQDFLTTMLMVDFKLLGRYVR